MIDRLYKKRFLLFIVFMTCSYVYVAFSMSQSDTPTNTEDKSSLYNKITETIREVNSEDKNKMLDALSCVVKIDNTNGTASGVMIYQDKPMVYVLSVAHILQQDRNKNNLFIHMFEDNSQIVKKYKADLICYDKYYDLSLLSFDYGERDTQTCSILNTDNICINTLDDIVSIGCLIGNRPSLSTGFIVGRMKVFAMQNMILSNAPVAPGASGGGIFKFHKGEYRLIGITIAMGGYGDVMFEHIGISIPSCYVYEWIFDNELETLLGL